MQIRLVQRYNYNLYYVYYHNNHNDDNDDTDDNDNDENNEQTGNSYNKNSQTYNDDKVDNDDTINNVVVVAQHEVRTFHTGVGSYFAGNNYKTHNYDNETSQHQSRHSGTSGHTTYSTWSLDE